MFDTIVIGGGPAGMSSAIYLLRAGCNIKVIAKDIGALEKAEIIENYFGIKTISGKELIKRGEEQITALGGEITKDEVSAVSFDGNYTVICREAEYKTRSLIIATGANRKKASVKDIEKFEGAGVSYCAVCDAFFYRGKSVGVLGSGNYALHEARELGGCSEVFLFTNGKEVNPPELVFPENVKIITEPIKELIGAERLEGVRLTDGSVTRIDGLFIAEGVASGADFARTLGISLNGGSIKVDEKMRTGAEGIFAAGDVTGGVLQISSAVGEGAAAALSAIEFLRKTKE